ncbi:c-type cytochrome [Polymorphobacter sp.]|uniref:c-type cytochrome n=1 Tax=Polymorphobacter sp. TaxID=1909290 RepID=UPI003F6F65C5
MRTILPLLAAALLPAQAFAACPASPPEGAAASNPAALEQGRRAFLKCRACHTLPEGGKNLVGPNLWNLFARAPLGAADFKYSPAFTAAAPAWTAAKLDSFLEKPSKHIPGTRMVFAGIPAPEERQALIAWLAKETGCK